MKDYINKHNPDLTNIFEKYISDKKIIYSSSHGDFYYRNIVKEQNKYYYIDLSNYSKKSCFVFDLINYKIFSSNYYNGNWYNFYKSKKKYFLKTLNNEYIELYVLWKIINEIKFIKLNKYKIKKYNFILNDFFKNFINKESYRC